MPVRSMKARLKNGAKTCQTEKKQAKTSSTPSESLENLVIAKKKRGPFEQKKISKALKHPDSFPKELKDALGGGSLRLDIERGEFIVSCTKGDKPDCASLKKFFRDNDRPEFCNWLKGGIEQDSKEKQAHPKTSADTHQRENSNPNKPKTSSKSLKTTSPNVPMHDVVIAKKRNGDFEQKKITQALKKPSCFPQELKYALGTGSLRLDSQRKEFVVSYKSGDKVDCSTLKKFFRDNDCSEFYGWLVGKVDRYVDDSEGEVVTKANQGADINGIRRALKKPHSFPPKLRKALGGAELRLNKGGEFMVIAHKDEKVRDCTLKIILGKNSLDGFVPWLEGAEGWVVKTEKEPHVSHFREIHEAYLSQVRALMKRVRPETKEFLDKLYYKMDGTGERLSTQTLWKKASKQESLQEAVSKIRYFLETLLYHIKRWKEFPWIEPSISVADFKKRNNLIKQVLQQLLRNSNNGPDVPVHWSHHSAQSGDYPCTTVTADVMEELAIGLTNILSLLLLRIPLNVGNITEMKRVLGKMKEQANNLLSAPKGSNPVGSLVAGMSKLAV